MYILAQYCSLRLKNTRVYIYKMFSYSIYYINFFSSRSLTSQDPKMIFIKFSKLFNIQKILPLSVSYC